MVDPGMKIVAHSESLVSQVKFLFMIWGDLFTLRQDGKVRSTELECGQPLTSNTDISISPKVAPAETADILSKKLVRLCHQSGAEVWNGRAATELHF